MIEIMLAYIFRKLNNPGDGSGDGTGNEPWSVIDHGKLRKLMALYGQNNDKLGTSVAISADGSTIVSGKPEDDIGLKDSGAVYVFRKRSDGSFLESQKLKASGLVTNYYFGTSVAISADGSTIVAGAIHDGDKGAGSGAAYIYTKQANGLYLETQKLIASDGASLDAFGGSLAVSADGSIVLISASGDDDKDNESGSVYIFTKQANGSYLQSQKLIAADGTARDAFGGSLAVTADGSTVIIGAWGDGDEYIYSGSVYVFTKQANGSYLQTQKLKASDERSSDNFGISVAVTADGATVIIGAPNGDGKVKDSGAVYVFTKQANGSYLQIQKLKASDGERGDVFGGRVGVTVNGSGVAIGAVGDDVKGLNSGSAYIFTKQANGSYLETNKLIPFDGEYGGSFGNSLAVSNISVAIGSPGNSYKKGAVYVYYAGNGTGNGTGDGTDNESWNGPHLEIDPEVFGKIIAYDGVSDFSCSVALSRNGLIYVLGSSRVDNEKGTDAGAAFIFFKQANGSYLQTQKLLASDGAANDWFGYSVSVSGDGTTVVVSAYLDDDKGTESGSAYIFTKQTNESYLQTQKLIASDGAVQDYFGGSVAISADGSIVLISAFGDDDKGNNSGSAYIFTKQANGSYLQTQKLLASDGAAQDHFGCSVAISGDGSTVVVGAYLDDDKGSNSGSAYVFTKQANGSYLETQKLLADDGATNDYFGRSVAISTDGSTIVIGAYGDSDRGSGSGSAYIFTKEPDGSYFETQKLLPTWGRTNDQFGYSVAVSGDGSTVIVGAPLHDTATDDYGATYIFTKQPDGSYLEIHKLVPPGNTYNHKFGSSLAISNISLAVGTNSNYVYVY